MITEKENPHTASPPKSTHLKPTIQPAISKVPLPNAISKSVLVDSSIINGCTPPTSNPANSKFAELLYQYTEQIKHAKTIAKLSIAANNAIQLFAEFLGFPKYQPLPEKEKRSASTCPQDQSEKSNPLFQRRKGINLPVGMTFRKFKRMKKAKGTWIDSFAEYSAKISSFKWEDLSTKDFTIVQINGKYYVKCDTNDAFKNALQVVMHAGKENGHPRPFLWIHPDSQKTISKSAKEAKGKRKKANNAKKRTTAVGANSQLLEKKEIEKCEC